LYREAACDSGRKGRAATRCYLSLAAQRLTGLELCALIPVVTDQPG